MPGLFLPRSRPWLWATAAERWFGTCSCKPVPRGLPSSDKQLRAIRPYGLSRSWHTLTSNPHLIRIWESRYSFEANIRQREVSATKPPATGITSPALYHQVVIQRSVATNDLRLLLRVQAH